MAARARRRAGLRGPDGCGRSRAPVCPAARCPRLRDRAPRSLKALARAPAGLNHVDGRTVVPSDNHPIAIQTNAAPIS